MDETLEQIKKRLSNAEDFGDCEKEDIDMIIDRLEGYELAYGVILKSNERLEEVNEMLKGILNQIYKDKYCLTVRVAEQIEKIVLNEQLPDEWKIR